MGAANEPRQARIRVERRLPLGVETKARSCRGYGRTFSTGSYIRRTVEAEIECEGEGRRRATSGRIADGERGGGGGGGGSDGGGDRRKKRKIEERERVRKGEIEERGVGIYNATIAGCDRSCELRVGNLGTVYADLREGCCRREGG